jgi:hypothetical protein
MDRLKVTVRGILESSKYLPTMGSEGDAFVINNKLVYWDSWVDVWIETCTLDAALVGLRLHIQRDPSALPRPRA